MTKDLKQKPHNALIVLLPGSFPQSGEIPPNVRYCQNYFVHTINYYLSLGAFFPNMLVYFKWLFQLLLSVKTMAEISLVVCLLFILLVFPLIYTSVTKVLCQHYHKGLVHNYSGRNYLVQLWHSPLHGRGQR